ncbi:MAG TPA: hypothetical protein VK116_08830, partial [Planctomycetota bacterium]|nr:hypothetical protein [Planctomycetota bacterium]
MAIVFCGCGCGKNVNSDLAVEHSFLAEERSSDARYLGAAIDIEGTVLGEDLLPIAGAVVRTIAWGEA